MKQVMTARLSESLEKDLNLVAKTEQQEKSTVLRKLLNKAVIEWKKEEAIKRYQQGVFSTEQAAEFMGASTWSFLTLLKEKKIPLLYDIEDFKKELKDIKWKK